MASRTGNTKFPSRFSTVINSLKKVLSSIFLNRIQHPNPIARNVSTAHPRRKRNVSIPLIPSLIPVIQIGIMNCLSKMNEHQHVTDSEAIERSVCAVTAMLEVRSSFSTSVRGSVEWFNFGELRQKNGNSSSEDLVASMVGDDSDIGKGNDYAKVSPSPVETQREETERSVLTKSKMVESVD